MSDHLDPRRHPYKADIAAKHLEGRVTAESFVEGKPHKIIEPLTDILSNEMGESRTTQAFFGERFTVYQTEGYWAWGQLETDGYVGWISALSLVHDDHAQPTHLVSTPLTRATADSIKVLGTGPIPMGAKIMATDPAIEVRGSSAPFAQTDTGTIPSAHLRAIGESISDWVSVAEMFLGTPYVWGGRSAVGIDCSALVQIALQQSGVAAPRDSDMQEADLGDPVDRADALQRGDLVFWPGHVGIMTDDAIMLHANAFAMSTAYEPLTEVEGRVGTARAIKRLR